MLGVQEYQTLQNPSLKGQEAKGPQRQNPNPSEQTGKAHQTADAGVEAGSTGEKTGLRERTVLNCWSGGWGERGWSPHCRQMSLTAEIQWLCPIVPKAPGHLWSHRLLP